MKKVITSLVLLSAISSFGQVVVGGQKATGNTFVFTGKLYSNDLPNSLAMTTGNNYSSRLICRQADQSKRIEYRNRFGSYKYFFIEKKSACILAQNCLLEGESVKFFVDRESLKIKEIKLSDKCLIDDFANQLNKEELINDLI